MSDKEKCWGTLLLAVQLIREIRALYKELRTKQKPP